MKELIYLDTEYVHSFIAQSEGGLPTTVDTERTEEITEQNDKEINKGTESFIEGKFKLGELEIPLLFKSPTGEITAGIKPINNSSERVSLSQLESGKEIISKKLHDDALERFENNISKEGNLTEELHEAKEGDFVKITSKFKIIDFGYLKKAFNGEKLIEFQFHDTEKELKSLEEELKKLEGKQKGLLKTQLAAMKKEMEQKKKEQLDTFTFLSSGLEYITDILPSESFLMADNIFVPLKDEFLRESSKDLTFKYGAFESRMKVNILGKITRIVDNVELPDFNGKFDFLQIGELVNFMLHSVGVLNKGDYLISPIAIYFE